MNRLCPVSPSMKMLPERACQCMWRCHQTGSLSELFCVLPDEDADVAVALADVTATIETPFQHRLGACNDSLCRPGRVVLSVMLGTSIYVLLYSKKECVVLFQDPLSAK